MTDERRRCWSKWILLAGASVMVVGFCSSFLFAQSGQSFGSQDAINATLFERQASLTARLDKLESMLTAGIIGVFSNLAASLMQLLRSKK